MIIWLELLESTQLSTPDQSGLALTRTNLQTFINDFAHGSHAVPTDTTELARVNLAVDMALRQFYWPGLVLGEAFVHLWSFMRPVSTMSTTADQWRYVLPNDFGGIEGELTFASDQSYRMIYVRGENFIRIKQQGSDASGVPRYAAVRTVKSDGKMGQASELLLWPTPDAEYNLTYRYNVIPAALSSTAPYALGGAVHAETILQSCRAAADKVFNDNIGAEYTSFKERLTASVLQDRRTMAPERLGYAHDPSMVQDRFLAFRQDSALPSVTVNGVIVQ